MASAFPPGPTTGVSLTTTGDVGNASRTMSDGGDAAPSIVPPAMRSLDLLELLSIALSIAVALCFLLTLAFYCRERSRRKFTRAQGRIGSIATVNTTAEACGVVPVTSAGKVSLELATSAEFGIPHATNAAVNRQHVLRQVPKPKQVCLIRSESSCLYDSCRRTSNRLSLEGNRLSLEGNRLSLDGGLLRAKPLTNTSSANGRETLKRKSTPNVLFSRRSSNSSDQHSYEAFTLPISGKAANTHSSNECVFLDLPAKGHPSRRTQRAKSQPAIHFPSPRSPPPTLAQDLGLMNAELWLVDNLLYDGVGGGSSSTCAADNNDLSGVYVTFVSPAVSRAKLPQD